jgi:fibronectin type 3 domain-containing protein
LIPLLLVVTYLAVDGTPALALLHPFNVQASDGTFTDKVRVTWADHPDPVSYRIYRATSSSGATQIGMAVQGTGLFDDSTAAVGTTYYYWVSGINSAGDESSLTGPNTGFRASAVSAPSNVQASDETFTDKVRVTWNAVSGATSYEAYRATSSGGAKTLLTTTAATSHDDTSASPGTIYYYWVRACIASDCSGFGSFDAGFRAVSDPSDSEIKSMPWLELLLLDD